MEEKEKKIPGAWIGKLLPSLKIKLIAIGVLVVVAAIVLIAVFANNKTASVDTTYLIGKLREASELTTAKLTYTGMAEYNDEGVAVISKSNFTMIYEAEARIGIDLQEVKITANDAKKVIYVEIPPVKVHDVNVNSEKTKYFDVKFSLFNFDQKEDANKAEALAKEAAKKEILEIGVCQMAEKQAESLIKGILANAVPGDYEIQVTQLFAEQ